MPAPSSVSTEPLEPAPIARPILLPELVDVRLASFERSADVRVSGVAGGALSFRLEGRQVRCSDGRRASSFELRGGPAGAELGLAERTYLGTLLVEPHGTGGLRVTNRVALEDYVAGVVAAELVLWSALPAELEAQAIAARSYAVCTLLERGYPRRGAFLWDDTRDQAYAGRFVPAPTERARAVGAALERAVRATAGRVLMSGERIVDARFHAACGGWTAAFDDIFPAGFGARSGAVACAPCAALASGDLRVSDERAPQVRWEWTASDATLARVAAALRVGRKVTALRPVRVDEHGRWLAVELDGELGKRRVDFDELRRRIGPTELKSARIVRTWPRPGEPIRGGLRFDGLGRGHGVGLCQTGAHEYAALGWSAARILEHYYPGARIEARALAPHG